MADNAHRYLTVIFSLVLFFVFIAGSAYAPPVYVSVTGKIQGRIDYQNYSSHLDSAPQAILMNLENIGSAGCIVKVRADFRKGDKYLGTSWSEIEPMEPGGHFLFHNYWMPDETGTITADITIYQCYELFDGGKILFQVVNSTVHETRNLHVTDVKNSKNEINLTITANRTLHNILIIPKDYPLGWIIEPRKIDNIEAGEQKTISIEYEPSTWHAQTLGFNIVTQDGSEFMRHEVHLKEIKPETPPFNKEIIIWFLLAMVVLLTIWIFRLKKQNKKRE